MQWDQLANEQGVEWRFRLPARPKEAILGAHEAHLDAVVRQPELLTEKPGVGVGVCHDAGAGEAPILQDRDRMAQREDLGEPVASRLDEAESFAF